MKRVCTGTNQRKDYSTFNSCLKPNGIHPTWSNRFLPRWRYEAHLKTCITDSFVNPFVYWSPDLKGLSEAIKKVCRPLNIKTIFTSKPELQATLIHVLLERCQSIPAPVNVLESTLDRQIGVAGSPSRNLRISKHTEAVMKAGKCYAITTHIWTWAHYPLEWIKGIMFEVKGVWQRHKIKGKKIRLEDRKQHQKKRMLCPNWIWAHLGKSSSFLTPNLMQHS